MRSFGTFALCVFLVNSAGFASALSKLDLTGNQWMIKEQNIPAIVPGGIYTDLMRNNKIGDVFYGHNDTETRWVSKQPWTYVLNFDVSDEFLAQNNINLVFEGVDTFSTILINNVALGTTDNMFVRYAFHVKPYLKVGENTLEVRFQSPVTRSKELYDAQARNYPVLPTCVPDEYKGECHANHARKMQASFSWDWGPAFPSMGIWKPVYLEGYHTAKIKYAVVSVKEETDGYWTLVYRTYFSGNPANEMIVGSLALEMYLDNRNLTSNVTTMFIPNEEGEIFNEGSVAILKSSVQSWWPNGYGDAKLYNMAITYTAPDGVDEDTVEVKVGFRSVELVQDELATGGREFYFKVNGVPIFAKGTNNIPIDILPERGRDPETIRHLMQSAKDVHMNMIRVWGGGNYEDDYFYELADEFGILIWQDFMFACSMYPATDEFLNNVKYEVRHQVRRLQNHPSIVLWAGSNENEAALRHNWYGTDRDFEQYKADFIKLYVDTIKPEILLNDDTRPYLTSSPTNGIKSEEEGHVSLLPQDTLYGDVHFYNYVLDSWNTSSYPITRFASEYGYQSLPVMETLLTATTNEQDFELSRAFMDSRQHHPNGYTEMQNLIKFRLDLPAESDPNFFQTFVYYCQILQAMAIKIETEFYRHWRSFLNEKGEGHTMGALYWQLNDVWVGPTWAGIDFTGKWKMLHYYAKNFFAPVIITGDLSPSGELDIFAVSDLMAARPRINVSVHVYRWDSLNPVHTRSHTVDILAGQSVHIAKYANNHLSTLPDNPCGNNAATNCFYYFQTEELTPDNFIFPIPLKSAAIPTADVQIVGIDGLSNGVEFTIQISTDVVALFVWLEARGIKGHFSENGFVQVTETKTVTFTAYQPVGLSEVRAALSLVHLKNLNPITIQPSGGQDTMRLSAFVVIFWSLLLKLY